MSIKAAQAIVEEMPPLAHSPRDGSVYSTENSEVIAWLMAHPSVKEMMFHVVRHHGWIKYDREARTWSGAKPDLSAQRPRPKRAPKASDEEILAVLPDAAPGFSHMKVTRLVGGHEKKMKSRLDELVASGRAVLTREPGCTSLYHRAATEPSVEV